MSFAKVMKCPVCNGEIRPDAIRCRSCGSLLSDGLTSGSGGQRFKVVLIVIAAAAASLVFFTLNRAGRADNHVESVSTEQTAIR